MNKKGRKMVFDGQHLPADVEKIVCVHISDYPRKERAIREATYEEEILAGYQKINAAIREAFTEIEAVCQVELFHDIKGNCGYERSRLSEIMSRGAYYRRKRKVIYTAARLMLLI